MSGQMPPDIYIGDEWPVETLPSDPEAPHNLLRTRSPDLSSMNYAFTSDSLSLHLSAEKQTELMENIEAIFQPEEEEALHGDQEMPDADDEEPEVDLEDQQKRTEKLKSILPTIAQLWWCRSEHMELATEKLADGSRNPKWRVPMGESGILKFFLQILSAHALNSKLKIQILRLVGNSCADTDENRSRVVSLSILPSIIDLLDNSSTLPFAIPVLYNICLDYEPAQKQASSYSLTKRLINMFVPERKWEVKPHVRYIRLIIELLVTQPTEVELAPENTAVIFIQFAAYSTENATRLEDFVSYVNLAVAYLQHSKFQKGLIAYGALDATLTALVNSYTRFDSRPVIEGPTVPDEEEAEALQQMRSGLNQALSDVSALPEFKEAVPVVSPFSSSLRRWLSSPQLQLQVCACIMLGNLARSDAACEEFVHTCAVHKPLVTVLTNANDPQLLHAALGFLKNLALPSKNKEAIGDTGIYDALPRLWLLDTSQQIQFTSISLARQLLTRTWANVRRVCEALSQDHDSPAHMRSKLSLLIGLFDRTDLEPIKMEIARLITAVCREFNALKGRTEEDMERLRKKFFAMHPDVGRPLGFMVSQDKWPVVRSEGWFVYALMARHPEGAQCISDLMHDVAVFQPLVHLLTGKNLVDYNPILMTSSEPSSAESSSTTTPGPVTSSPLNIQTPESLKTDAQAAEMARIDRQNALVLVSELLRNRGGEMAVMRKALFEDLLKGGANTLLANQDAVSNQEDKKKPPAPSGDGLAVGELASYSM